MVDTEYPCQRSLAHLICGISLSLASVHGQPAEHASHTVEDVSPPAGDRLGASVAVPLENSPLMLVVLAAGDEAGSVKSQIDGRSVSVKVIGHDPVSRLGFVQVESGVTGRVTWAAAATGSLYADLTYSDHAGRTMGCRSDGWVKQVRGKVLPFALLRVRFPGLVPPPGTPLLDRAGSIVAVVFQDSGGENVAFCIPAEAVHRVKKDVASGGKLTRGWLGMALRAESQSPVISRVLPTSPAAEAGIMPGDVLTSIGPRAIVDYADAANAFFYMTPGTPVTVQLQRGSQKLQKTLTPVVPR